MHVYETHQQYTLSPRLQADCGCYDFPFERARRGAKHRKKELCRLVGLCRFGSKNSMRSHVLRKVIQLVTARASRLQV